MKTNTKRIGVNHFAISEIYSSLITMSWLKFFSVIGLTYLSLTIVFTLAYSVTDFKYFNGLPNSDYLNNFWLVFLYSAQTLSTVGGAGITPIGVHYNSILAVQSITAMLGMAIITGLLYVRFSKPLAEIVYSKSVLISPYKDGKALMIRIANGRKNELVGITTNVFLKVSDLSSARREVFQLTLERNSLPFLASTWTIVHPIDKESQLYNFTAIDQSNIQYDISIWLNGKDSVTGQDVFSNHTYLHDDIIHGAKFLPCMDVDKNGLFYVYLDKVGDYEKLSDYV